MQTSLLDFYSYTRFYQLQNDLEGKTNNISISNPKGKEIYSYLEDIIKKSEEKNLYEKYATSINLIMNKDQMELNKDLSEEMYMSLINWITIEKNNLEKNLLLNKNLNIYININIFIGFLINIISIFEIFDIKNFVKNNFKSKLNDIYIFLKNYLILNFIYPNPIYANISLDFLLKKIESLLLKIKAQEECYLLSQDIFKFLKNENEKFLSKKRMRGSSQSKKNTKNKKNKRVSFDLNKNVIHIFNKDEIIAKLV